MSFSSSLLTVMMFTKRKLYPLWTLESASRWLAPTHEGYLEYESKFVPLGQHSKQPSLCSHKCSKTGFLSCTNSRSCCIHVKDSKWLLPSIFTGDGFSCREAAAPSFLPQQGGTLARVGSEWKLFASSRCLCHLTHPRAHGDLWIMAGGSLQQAYSV